jgi:hypothetical protein
MPHTPDPQITDPPPYYTTDEIDTAFATVDAELVDHEDRITALEAGTPPPVDPPVDPGPVHGVDLVVQWDPPPELTQGVPVDLEATLTNLGDEAIPAGPIIGVGFFCDGVQASWWSTMAGLEAGASVTYTTSSGPMHGGAWRPAVAGEHTLTAWVDDLNRIPEWDDQNNKADVVVTIAEGTPPPAGQATLFTAASSWNTPKAVTQFDADADARLRSLSYGINNGDFSHPLTYSTANDPTATVDCPDSWGWPAGRITINLRDDALPAGGTDGHLAVVNADGRLLDFWQFHNIGYRAWACSAWAQHNWQTGIGWGVASPFQSAGVTAAGAPTAAGTITAAEVDAGVIPHALCMAFDYNDQGGVNTSWQPGIPPAINNDVGGGPGPICEGALLVAVGNEPAGLNDAERALWTAARTYGCWVIDKLDGAPQFYGDRSATVGGAFRADKVTAIGRQLRMAVTW